MMTSPIVTTRIRAEGTDRVANLLKSGKSDDELIEELFLATLSRRPKTQEVEVAKRVIAKDKKIGFEDIQWALLNTTEFLVNH
jgi:flagella basal body P-ring formation protein FlgA